MGTVTCSRCNAKTTADSIKNGRGKLDHSIGLYKGKPCEDGKAELFFTSNETMVKKIVVTSPKKKIEQSSSTKTIDNKSKASSKK